MLWIMGGETLIQALAKWCPQPWLVKISGQMEHVPWNGFHFYDIIFPTFLFLAGVSLPFSLGKRLQQGEAKRELYKHFIKRALILVLLGIIYNGFFQTLDLAHARYASVLGRIGLAWFFAAIIVMNTRVKFQLGIFVGILLSYWALLEWVPVPGFGAGVLTPEGCLASYLDQKFLPGRLYLGTLDPEGIISLLPSICTALLGSFCGLFLKWDSSRFAGYKKSLALAGAAMVLLLIARVWNIVFPINKTLWSSSFVLYAGGWSMLALAIFFQLIDVWGYRKWSFPFVVIGMNSITIYMAQTVFFDFGSTRDKLFKGTIHLFSQTAQPVISAVAYVLCCWLFLYFLYRRKIFLKV